MHYSLTTGACILPSRDHVLFYLLWERPRRKEEQRGRHDSTGRGGLKIKSQAGVERLWHPKQGGRHEGQHRCSFSSLRPGLALCPDQEQNRQTSATRPEWRGASDLSHLGRTQDCRSGMYTLLWFQHYKETEVCQVHELHRRILCQNQTKPNHKVYYGINSFFSKF